MQLYLGMFCPDLLLICTADGIAAGAESSLKHTILPACNPAAMRSCRAACGDQANVRICPSSETAATVRKRDECLVCCVEEQSG